MRKLNWIVSLSFLVLASPSWAGSGAEPRHPEGANRVRRYDTGERIATLGLAFGAAPLVVAVEESMKNLGDPSSPQAQWHTTRVARMRAIEKSISSLSPLPNVEVAALRATIPGAGATRRAMVAVVAAKNAVIGGKIAELNRMLKSVKGGAGFPARVRLANRVGLPALKVAVALNLLAAGKTALYDDDVENDVDAVLLPAVYQGRKLLASEPAASASVEAPSRESAPAGQAR